jgi:transcriptional regulator with PAS, ATPase and Fis domain
MHHFLAKYNAFMNKRIVGFTERVEIVYENYGWPGNVRELENAVEYGVNMAHGDRIDTDAIPARLLRGGDDRDQQRSYLPQKGDAPLSEQMRAYEKEIIVKRLAQYGAGRRAKEAVAKELGISRATLYRRLSEIDGSS